MKLESAGQAATKRHRRHKTVEVARNRILTVLPLIVPEGQNMNSRGRQPTEQQQNRFDPTGVAQKCNQPAMGFTHGYSCWAALRPDDWRPSWLRFLLSFSSQLAAAFSLTTNP
jgi:hypothetical protein